MANKYIYDPDSLSYKRIKSGLFASILKSIVFQFAIIFLSSFILFIIISTFISTPNELRMKRENKILLLKYKELNIKLNHISLVLNELQERDDNIYRMVFGKKPLPRTLREAGYGGSKEFENLENLDNAGLLIETSQKLNKISRKLKIQSKSYTEIINLVRKREERISSIPAIQPISNDDLLHPPYGYGPRIDPVYKTPSFHHGMDFSAHTGTPIYATADGVIIRADANSQGYGKHVRINHGYGYKTLYAHMSKILVKPGQHVKRGEIIGLVGNTGKSVGPHVHYEVRVNDKPVNPINYYFNDLTPDQYSKLTILASRGNHCLD